MPDDLKQEKKEIDRLTAEEEQAGVERDYERAVKLKAERLRLEEEFKEKRSLWEAEHKLDDMWTQMISLPSFTVDWHPSNPLLESNHKNCLKWKPGCTTALLVRMKPSRQSPMPSARSLRTERPNRPIGSFIFIGPSGVGKTELAKALADSSLTTRTPW
jgi:ATP-dependent Clp protease ATP-binding subunit ClpC